ncbi:MAG TPA: type IV pilus assembly protein PilM [Myxococcales bacterium]|jgi:type IV pilus assembly protein PilM|nr:type IV pilus assembly protein PilM [Myxococcales bacterium]
MAKNCIGLDLGSSSVKVTQIKKGRSGFQLLNFGIEPVPPDTIVDGAILNHSGVVDAVRALLDRLKIKQKEVALAISGNALIIKKIFVPAMTADELEEQVPWEAEHHIPFNKNDVEIDYQVLGGKNAAGQMELLLVAAKKEVVADYAAVAREASLNPVVVDVAAFAVQNGFEAAYGTSNETVALVNVGASLSTINIISGGTSAFTRDVTTGGNSFTDDIKRQLGVSGEEAEALKVSYGDGEGSPDVARMMTMTAHQMAGEFQKSIDFFLSSHPDTAIGKISLSGGSSKVAMLRSAIEQRARVAVEVMDPFRNVPHGPGADPAYLHEHGAQGVVSLGLALRSPGDKFE